MDLEEDSELDGEDLPDCHVLISVCAGWVQVTLPTPSTDWQSVKGQY